MKKEKSCGAVIYREEVDEDSMKRLFLIVKYVKGDNYWGLVKGHIENNETEHETAKREIYEEVGITEFEFIDDFKEVITYSPENNVMKDVVFFLAKTNQEKVTYHWKEHNDHKWLSAKDSINKLTYEKDKKIIRKANEFLESKD